MASRQSQGNALEAGDDACKRPGLRAHCQALVCGSLLLPLLARPPPVWNAFSIEC